jgi:hypothetical protein
MKNIATIGKVNTLTRILRRRAATEASTQSHLPTDRPLENMDLRKFQLKNSAHHRGYMKNSYGLLFCEKTKKLRIRPKPAPAISRTRYPCRIRTAAFHASKKISAPIRYVVPHYLIANRFSLISLPTAAGSTTRNSNSL